MAFYEVTIKYVILKDNKEVTKEYKGLDYDLSYLISGLVSDHIKGDIHLQLVTGHMSNDNIYWKSFSLVSIKTMFQNLGVRPMLSKEMLGLLYLV